MAKKILLIEYEPRYLDRIRGYLAGKDFDLVVAKDGEEGLDNYRKSRPDLVLISSVLPKLRTPDVIKGMQSVGSTPPILLMMSGYKGKNKRSDAQRVGATSILEKPFGEDVFLEEINSALGSRPLAVPSSQDVFQDAGAPLFSSDDIFSDVISGVEDDSRAASLPAPPGGTDPGIQKKLEQTLSGILPAPKKLTAGTTSGVPASRADAPKASSGSTSAPRPAPKPVQAEATVRLEAINFNAPLAPAPAPVPPAPAPAAPPASPTRASLSSASVDKMLTDTLSGLKVKSSEKPAAPRADGSASGPRPVVAAAPKPVEKPAPPAPPAPAPKAPAKTSREAASDRFAESLRSLPSSAPPPEEPSFSPSDPTERYSFQDEQPATMRLDTRSEAAKPRAPEPPPPPPQRRDEKRASTTSSIMATGPGAFGRYTLLEKIASGGMAEVFKARMRGEEGFEKIVAIKRILPHMADNDDFITMFIDEAKLAAQLTHNNIIHIYDLGKVEAYHYIAMEYVEGKDLRSILKMGQERGYPLPPELALFVASKIANALDYAHRRVGMDGKELNLVHRDVSPQNILISFEGDIKLCDFGIAKATTKVSQTQTGALKGKLQYMSPEQAWGKKIDRRTDIFSLGIVLFEMLTGERLFTGDTDLTILEQVRDAKVVAPSTKNYEVPKKVDQIVLKALAKNPQDRYQYAGEFEKDLVAGLFTFQPTPGPADLAIYMHRLMEATPQATDEQIDDAFRKAEMDMPLPEKEKKGKGLVIAKKAPQEKKAAPAPAPEPEPYEVSSPAVALEEEKSKAGLFIGIAVAVVIIGAIVMFLMKPKPKPVEPTPGPTTEQAPPEPTATPIGPTPTPEVRLNKEELDQKVKEELARRKAEAAAAQQAVPTAAAPAVVPTAVKAVPQPGLLQPKGGPVQPPVQAEPTRPAPAPAPPTAVPTEVPKAAPPTAVPTAVPAAPVAPPVAPPAAGVETVGESEEGVVPAKLIRLAPIQLPPQAKNISRGKGEGLGSPTILALISERGQVVEARVLKPSSYKFVDEAVVNALKNSTFEPATKNGVKVRMWKPFVVPVKP